MDADELTMFMNTYPFMLVSSAGPDNTRYPNEVIPGLFIGGRATVHQAAVDRLALTMVVNTASELPPPALAWPHTATARGVVDVGVDDVPEQKLTEEYWAAARDAAAEHARGGRVLVACNMGISRSSTMLAAVLLMRGIGPLTETMALIRRARPFVLPNPGFVAQLKAWEEENYA